MRKFLSALALSALFAAPASADGAFGIKAGQLSFDGDKSAAKQVGLVYTWDIAGMFGVEGEVNTTFSDGKVNVGPATTADYSATQVAGYGVLMSPGAFYFKGKAGLAYTSVDVSGLSDSSTDASYGVGVGFELFGFVWEVEYTITNTSVADADYISVSFKF